MSNLHIEIATLGPVETNAFVLRTDQGSLLIDAPEGSFPWVKRLLGDDGLPDALLLTHGHWDHTDDLIHFSNADVPLYGHLGDRDLFERPEVMAPYAMPGKSFRGVSIGQWVKDGDELHLIGESIRVLHVPGHAPGNVTFYFPDHRIAFVGDVIFRQSVGRYDLPGGDLDTLERSIREKIYHLPDDTTLYPGHGPATTVAFEKQNNPFVQLQ